MHKRCGQRELYQQVLTAVLPIGRGSKQSGPTAGYVGGGGKSATVHGWGRGTKSSWVAFRPLGR